MDGRTLVCGVIANPVAHSMSPVLQNLYAQRTGVNLAYVPFKVEPDMLQEMIQGAYAMNILGLNVTVPFKSQVMPFLKEIDETAEDIGAVNTLIRIDGGYKGYNSDVPGITRVIQEEGYEVDGRDCIVIGAGGAAHAACYALMKLGVRHIYVLNRTQARSDELEHWMNSLAGRKIIMSLPLDAWDWIPGDGYLAVQTTSVGMTPNVGRAAIEDPEFYKKIRCAIDCIYTPTETKFMQNVKAAGGKAVNGLRMLLYQGIVSYEIWNPGVKVSEETVLEAEQAIMEMLGQ